MRAQRRGGCNDVPHNQQNNRKRKPASTGAWIATSAAATCYAAATVENYTVKPPVSLHHPIVSYSLLCQGSLARRARVFAFAPTLAVRSRAGVQPIQFLDVRDPACLDGTTMALLHISLSLFVGSHQFPLSQPGGFGPQNPVVR